MAETILKEMEWSASRTGLINPVAIFDPVELEGTTVSRASVHNISVMRDLKLGLGDRITVYKANMIIPQIAENLTASNSIHVPDSCPVSVSTRRRLEMITVWRHVFLHQSRMSGEADQELYPVRVERCDEHRRPF